jgi:hypothetical protein
MPRIMAIEMLTKTTNHRQGGVHTALRQPTEHTVNVKSRAAVALEQAVSRHGDSMIC